jgi:uncharacterized protein YcbX
VPTLARIAVTPVKSLALAHPERAALERSGFPADRRFFLVDDAGRLFTGAELGPLVTIRATYDPRSDHLELRFPDGIALEGDGGLLGDPLVTDFYGRGVPAHEVEGPWRAALSRFAGATVRLARCDREGDGLDVHHVTLVSHASVEELARRGGHDGSLDPRRFRMNLELDGCAPHEEDGWSGRELRVGETILKVHGPVPRCVVTTQSPATGEKDFETLKVVARYRGHRFPHVRIPFGMYAEVVRPGEVARGDEVAPAP